MEDKSRLYVPVVLLCLLAGLGLPSLAQGQGRTTVTKVVLVQGASVYGKIIGRSDKTITVQIAESNDRITIERERIISIEEVPRRQQMLVTQLSWNPSLYYYRSLVDEIAIGAFADYQWKGLGMGDLKAVEAGLVVRVLPFGTDLRGGYLESYLGHASVLADPLNHSFEEWWSVGYLFGWQWFPMYNVGASAAMGLERWYTPSWESQYVDDGDGDGGTGMLIMRLQVGYAW